MKEKKRKHKNRKKKRKKVQEEANKNKNRNGQNRSKRKTIGRAKKNSTIMAVLPDIIASRSSEESMPTRSS